jgi:hypothetical protein
MRRPVTWYASARSPRASTADDVFVERLAGAEAEPVTIRVHGGEGRRHVRHHGRVEAEGRARHAGTMSPVVRSPIAVSTFQPRILRAE